MTGAPLKSAASLLLTQELCCAFPCLHAELQGTESIYSGSWGEENRSLDDIILPTATKRQKIISVLITMYFSSVRASVFIMLIS